MDFGELIGNGKSYRVPPFQRDYSWADEQWEDLWTDILELRAEPDESHYMGALVVEAQSDREFAIIDGQQRITTLSILALAVIARLRELSVEAGDDNDARAAELRRSFIGDRNPASLVESSKLTLNENDDPFYQDYLVQLRTPVNVRRLTRSSRLLYQCFQYFQARVSQLAPAAEDGAALARFLNEQVARQLLFIVITVEDEMNAYTVFEMLNARGLELTTTDLLKNYLFSRVSVPADLDVLQRRWRTMIATVSAERFPEFLRYHYLTTEPQVRSARLFKLVRSRTRSAADVFDLMERLENRAELFAALGDPNHGYWVDYPDARPYIREIGWFRVKQMTPLLFAAWEHQSRPDFVKVLRTVTTVLFRFTVVSDQNTNLLEPLSHRAAKAVMEENASPRDVARVLREAYMDDVKFEQDFSRLRLETSGQSKRLAKYILARLEADASGRDVDPETDPATIEHILPENPSTNWEGAFSADEVDGYTFRLGNLTLLEPSKNREIANRPYGEKVEAYAGSSYTLARDVASSAPSEWTPAHIDDRQRRLAKRATHLWRLDI